MFPPSGPNLYSTNTNQSYPIGPTGTSGLNFPVQTMNSSPATFSSTSSSGASTTQYDPVSGRNVSVPAPVNRVVGASIASAGGGGGGTPSIAPQPTTPAYGDPGTFGAAVQQQTGDYQAIMDRLNAIASGPSSPDVSTSLNNLNTLSTTGGYSPQDIADLRARAVAPIRSIYSSARQNLDRSKSLSGGYSPNAGAAEAQLARDESTQVGGALTNANAGIEQNVAQNKLSIAPAYSTAALGESGLRLGANNAASSLYGTSPGLISTLGNQVAQATGLGQNQQQINQNQQNALLRFIQSLTAGGY